MPSYQQLAILALLFTTSTSHFVVNTPTPLGSNIDNEDQGPCGGFTPSSTSNMTDFHVGGDAIGITTLHAQSSIAYRGMLGQSLTSANWTLLIPTLEQFGLNGFCEPSIPVPADWAGQQGLLQVVQDAEDGVHYQCMAVNFVAGASGTPSSATCFNSSGVSANYQADNTLQQLGSSGALSSSVTSSAPQATSSSHPSSTSAAPSASATKSAAAPTICFDAISSIILLSSLLIAMMSI